MKISDTVKAQSVDPASREILQLAADQEIETVWNRLEKQLPQCGFGELGLCCRICMMGPCRIDPFGEGAQKGACGADADTIVARHLVRMIAAGAAAHSDHGRRPALLLKEIATGRNQEYRISDPEKLKTIAARLGLESKNCDINELALQVADIALNDFGKQNEETLAFVKAYAPKKRLERWQKIADNLSSLSNKTIGILPRGIDREIVDIMHRTHFGVDHGPLSLIAQGVRAAIGDGWGGSMIATDLQDIMFGTPYPTQGDINLGCLDEATVNVIVHGHEPLLSEMIVVASQDPEMVEYAKSKGATGITLAGMCCTANEILQRHGLPIAGNYLQQELAIVTGAVDAMVVDVQCIMENIANVAECYHTKVITTNPRAMIASGNVEHIEFDEHSALEDGKKIVKMAIDNYPNRKAEVMIPSQKEHQVVGFSYEAINYHLGGTFRGSYVPLNDNIMNGRIRGIAGVVGCNNARTSHDSSHLILIKELLKNDVIVLTTGCAAMACGKAGLLTPEAAGVYCGAGLAEVCETVGIPPVLHMGSCVDNSRILLAATEVIKAGGLGKDISEAPVAGAAPEWMSEKAISIGHYFVASGVYTVFGITLPVTGAPVFQDYIFNELEDLYGGMWDLIEDPYEMARSMIAHIDKKRNALGLDKGKERVLMDMADRQKLDAA